MDGNNLSRGDTLKLRPELAEGFLMPLRKYAREGRPATVTGARENSYIVEFEWRGRKPKPISPGMHEVRKTDIIPLTTSTVGS